MAFGKEKKKARKNEKRFWKKVERGWDDEDCWLWLGAVSSRDKVGVVKREGRMLFAHRVAWELVNGPLEEGCRLRRKCGNKVCVNPAHIVKSG